MTTEKRIRVIFDPGTVRERSEFVNSNLAALALARKLAAVGESHRCFITFDYASNERGDCLDLHAGGAS